MSLSLDSIIIHLMHFNKSPSIQFLSVMFNCLHFASLHQLLAHMKVWQIYNKDEPRLDHRATLPAWLGHFVSLLSLSKFKYS